ncbi:alanine:cation symporter family protein [Exiguobacterium sp. SH3S2]|uniref:alanine/glycine:cation symporter family protein n=1 Tax=unclassified Exiguobacterium TaxID=2644629 RepID=UPI00103B62CD|nr:MULTISPECIES: alanine/glycine:cation symporter family protein [unclassified Exiguobacterium]TCI47197.1 alanine:cation symporter family protein [Exiguobacterium sp. SH3S3]TCI51839.1 alanine:cation symporter family protein [Exiguobacterium sp. SH5S13]TCI62295.1 alanine:cation symporter family protein [Exiguobacterium sp. SH3S1]TCI62345.1 alanine:cation symporter family protein [Exiguobacterium sp. SH3S2]
MENMIEKFVGQANDLLWSSVLIVVLVALGLYFTIRMGFVQFRMLPEMFRLLFKDGMKREKGQVSSFQAFAIGTAARVGTGNIAGVATAIALGGPGAVFWMWIIALVGSASAFVESTLAQVYKIRDGRTWRGGPAYYMERALGQRWLGILFAILITFSFGFAFNSVQSNTISLSMSNQFGVSPTTVGLVLAAITAIVIFGGIQSIAMLSSIIVPIMAGGYILLALWIMISNASLLPSVFGLIFSEGVLGLEQLFGGAIGAMVLQGIRRGLFSNEAGMGSAPNAAATAEVSHPVKQGLIQSFSVFVDTLIICTSTAMIILLSGVAGSDSFAGVELTQAALTAEIGPMATSFLTIAIFLFAFSSILGNYYYGETNIQFISNKKIYVTLYRIGVVGMVLFGAVRSAGLVWSIADVFMGLMALVNLYAIFRLAKVARLVLDDYLEQRRQGDDPVFYADSIEDLPGREYLEAWDNEEEEVKTGTFRS